MVLKNFYFEHMTLIISILSNNKYYLTLTRRTNRIDRVYKLCNVFTSTTFSHKMCVLFAIFTAIFATSIPSHQIYHLNTFFQGKNSQFYTFFQPIFMQFLTLFQLFDDIIN